VPEEQYADRENESVLLKTLGNSPKLRIVDFFLENPLFDFTKKEVIEALGNEQVDILQTLPGHRKERDSQDNEEDRESQTLQA